MERIHGPTVSSAAVLLDRDGTLNVDKNYLSDPSQLELLPGTSLGLRRLKARGFKLVVVTNQSGIGRGYFDEARLDSIHVRLRELLRSEGVELDAIYVCPHVPEARCDCRKPGIGLGLRAAEELGLDLKRCFVIGDKASDLDFGRSLGAKTLLVGTGYGRETAQTGARADYVVEDLDAAADVIEGLTR